jgi:hypothetical protein
VTLHRKVKTWPFGSAKWFWPTIFAQFALLQLAAFLLLANFRQIPFFEKYDFDLYEGFSILKKGTNSSDFEKKSFTITRFLLLVPIGSQKCRKILIFSYFHKILTCGQIWLNHFQDDSHLGYITKLEKETLAVSERHGKCRHLRKVQ